MTRYEIILQTSRERIPKRRGFDIDIWRTICTKIGWRSDQSFIGRFKGFSGKTGNW